MKGITSNLLLALIISIISYGILSWDRTFHPVVSQQKMSDQILAIIIWICCLLIYFFILPLMLTAKEFSKSAVQWPFAETITLGLGILLTLLLFNGFLQRWPEIFNSDLEIIFLLYLSASMSYVLALNKTVASWLESNWKKVIANITVTSLSGFVVIALSWAVLYFE